MEYTVLGLFDNIEYVSKTVKPLENMGVEHSDTRLLSSVPYPEGAVFEDHFEPPIWKFAFVVGVCGFIGALALAGGTQVLMNLDVGGKAPFSLPPVAIIAYEFTLLGAVLGTIAGMLWFQGLPDWNDLAYDKDIHHGKIGLLIRCENEENAKKVASIMKDHGAGRIKEGKDDF